MIKINTVECKEGFASIDRSGPICGWRGEALFTVPQKTIDMKNIGEYSGPLFGYSDKPIDISGMIYITSQKENDDKLIEGVTFVGTGSPVDKQGRKLKAPPL